MSEAIIAKKAEQVELIAEKMKAAASIVVVDSRGLTVDQDTVLRRSLRESGVEFKVIKNSILTRAAEKAGLDELKDVFVGPSAVASRRGRRVAVDRCGTGGVGFQRRLSHAPSQMLFGYKLIRTACARTVPGRQTDCPA